MGLLTQATNPNAVTNPTGVNTPAVTPPNPSAPPKTQLQSTVQASSYTADLDPKALAANQLKEFTAKDSPLMQRAWAQGQRDAGARGFTSGSSIAAGASTGAMVDRATPIVTQDAQAFANRQSENLAAQNRTAMFNAEQQNIAVNQANSLVQDIERLEKEGSVKSQLQAQSLREDLQRLQEQGGIDINKLERGSELRREELGVESGLNLVEQERRMELERLANQEAEADRRQTTLLSNQALEAERRQTMILENKFQDKRLQDEFVMRAAELEAQVGRDAALEQIRTDGQLMVDQVRAANEDLINRNQSVSNLHQTYQQSISNIYSNSNITLEQAARATAKAKTAFEGAMDLLSAMGGVGQVTNTPQTSDIQTPDSTKQRQAKSEIARLYSGTTAENEAGKAAAIDQIGREAGMTPEAIDAAAGAPRGTTARFRQQMGWAP